VFNTTGALVHENGQQFAEKMVSIAPEFFNIDGEDRVEDERRSDNKGNECESLAFGELANGQKLLFVGLERPGLISIFDASNLAAPVFHSFKTIVSQSECVAANGESGLIDPEAMKSQPNSIGLARTVRLNFEHFTVFEISTKTISSESDLDVCTRAANGEFLLSPRPIMSPIMLPT